MTDGNTGVEVRSRVDKTGKRPFEGYHADIGHVGIGDVVLGAWDFHFAKRKEFPCKRGTSLVIDKDGKGTHTNIPEAEVAKLSDIKKRDWNVCRIVSKGNHHKFYINGKLASEFTDGIENGQFGSGFIGLQLHEAGMIVEFKDLFLKKG